MSVNLMSKAAAVLAGILTAVVMAATPAAATEGWFLHSAGYPGHIFGEMPCYDRGHELVAADEIEGFDCRYNRGLWDLWAIDGTWVYHSTHNDVWVCMDAGDVQVAAGNAYIYDCVATPGSNRTVDLRIIGT